MSDTTKVVLIVTQPESLYPVPNISVVLLVKSGSATLTYVGNVMLEQVIDVARDRARAKTLTDMGLAWIKIQLSPNDEDTVKHTFGWIRVMRVRPGPDYKELLAKYPDLLPKGIKSWPT